jgi:two-component system NarL family response regulator
MRSPKIKILVADDHPYIRDGIVSIVAAEKDMQVVAQAANGTEAVALTKKNRPDIVLLDLRMPQLDGLDALTQIQSFGLASKVVVLTTYESEQDVHLALKRGARGYLLKDIPRLMLLDAIRRVHRGETCIPPCIGQKLVENMNHPTLTARELDIIKSIADGKSNKEIGVQFGITEGTVKSHVKRLLPKLKAPGRTAAVREAVRRGLVHMS